MELSAHYERIQHKIIERLGLAENKIEVAVAWFTNHLLMEKLLEKLSDRVDVEVIILNDRINFRSKAIDFERFIKCGGKLRLGTSEKRLHHKICILDSKEIITGSYNWTYFAENNNHENIIVAEGYPLS